MVNGRWEVTEPCKEASTLRTDLSPFAGFLYRALDDGREIAAIALRLMELDPKYRMVSHAHLAVVAGHIWRECLKQGEGVKAEGERLARDETPQWQLLRRAANEGWCQAERILLGKEFPDDPRRVKWLNEESGYYVPEMGQVETEPVPTHKDARHHPEGLHG